MLRAVESASVFSLLTNIENEINASLLNLVNIPVQSQTCVNMADTYINPIFSSVKH